MDDIITNYSARRVFYVLSSIILLMLLVIRFFVVPSSAGILSGPVIVIINSVVDNLLASFFVTIIVGSFYFWLTGRVNDQKFELIPSISIEDELKRCRMNTDFWYYSGGTGRYTRAKTIPELAKIARERNEHKFLKLVLIDPTDLKTCESYSHYRSSLKSAKGKKEWTVDFVSQESYATIVACAVWKTREPLLEFSIGVKNSYSLFRIDQGQWSVVVTREDPREPAILANSNTLLYKFYKDEFHQNFRQAQLLPMPLRFVDFCDLSEANVSELFKSLNICADQRALDFNKIIEMAKKSENPYD